MLAFIASLAAVSAPVTAVTVYSDRARVTRSAGVTVNGTVRVDLPLLVDGVDPSTIWVDASGAEVLRVDIAHVDAGEFPADQARDLLGKMEKLDDELSRLRGERAAAEALLKIVEQLRPVASTNDTLRPLPKLNSGGWSAVFTFVESWGDRLQTRLRGLDEKLTDLGRDQETLRERARLVGGAARHSGYRVTPTLSGSGPARLTVSYVVGHARWYPTYDLQLDADKGQVQIRFAGRVSQETGEDWVDAKLTLSTAVPATSMVFPTLATWKIGERERFIPTARPAVERFLAPPPSVPLPVTEREDEKLRRSLLAMVGPTGTPKTEPETTNGYEDRDGDGIVDSLDRCPDENANSPGDQDGCPTAGDHKKNDEDQTKLRDLEKRTEQLKEEVVRTKARVNLLQNEVVVSAQSAPAKASFYAAEPPPPIAEVGLAPPSGWRAPTYAPDLPASLAGGYDLLFPSLRSETVKSGASQRRVALFAETWPVSAERRLFPALAPDAFVVAEIRNPSQRVLPGGVANLFVGADPAGTAKLNVVAPGETFTLPLGIDRAVKPIRNLKLSTTEKGIIHKDELTEYQVTIEVANPYRSSLRTRIVDQWPLSSDKNVEVKLLRSEPGAFADKVKGVLEWQLTVPPSGKSAVSFVYTLRRPKGWRLHQ